MLIAGLALPLSAQFSHLTATDDGKYLYFTSKLTLKNSGKLLPEQDRLYRFGPEGAAMIAEAETFGPQWRHLMLRVSAPWVSGDGEVVGLTLHGVCDGGAGSCGELMFRGGKNLDLGTGSVHVSRNGKWALLTADNGSPIARSATLVEIGTGERTTVPAPPCCGSSAFALASDGSFLASLSPGGGLSLATPAGVWKAGKFTPLAPYRSRMVQPLALSDDASTVVLVGGGQVVARDLASGRDSALFTLGVQTGPQHFPQIATMLGLSNNGQRVLFRVGDNNAAEGRAYLSDVPSGKTEPMPLAEGELVTDGTLSGSGDLVFLVTTAGRLVKVTLSTGAVDTLIPAPAYVAGTGGSWGFGSLLHMRGAAFTGSASDWKNRILIDNQPAPVLAAKPGQLDIQIPWSASTGTVPFRIVDSGPSPFEQNGMVLARPYGIALEPAGPGEPNLFGMKASNGDATGPPPGQPGPGDTFRLYFTGLGPVENQPETGAPASATTASPIKGKLFCNFLPHTSPVATVSASLVPGAIGLYQATFRMPPNAVPAALFCADCELCGPCEGDPFPYHGRCGDACMVSATNCSVGGRGLEFVP